MPHDNINLTVHPGSDPIWCEYCNTPTEGRVMNLMEGVACLPCAAKQFRKYADDLAQMAAEDRAASSNPQS